MLRKEVAAIGMLYAMSSSLLSVGFSLQVRVSACFSFLYHRNGNAGSSQMMESWALRIVYG